MNKRVKVIRNKYVWEKLGIKKSTGYNWTNPKSKYYKPDFPRLVRIGGISGRIEQELDDYILRSAECPRTKQGGNS